MCQAHHLCYAVTHSFSDIYFTAVSELQTPQTPPNKPPLDCGTMWNMASPRLMFADVDDQTIPNRLAST